MKRFTVPSLILGLLVLFGATACLGRRSDWARRDFPTDGLEKVVEYRLNGTANSDELKNESTMRGVNENAPQQEQFVQFKQMSGLKTEDVYVTLPDGKQMFALNMAKVQRFAGLTKFLDLETAFYSGVDANGNVFCAVRVRLTFTRNLIQYADPNQRDYDTLWLYDIPCSKDGFTFKLDIKAAKLRSIVLNEVWQFRVAAKPLFWNWGHSATIINVPISLQGGWWSNWETADGNDTMNAAKIANSMIADLSSSQQPWLEFTKGGPFDNATVIYSAGDADKYATWDRILLNRQTEWVVFYRPDRQTPWDYVIVQPVYNWEWNLAVKDLVALKGWGDDPLSDQLNEVGIPKDIANEKVQALERVGFANAPNPTLSQVRFLDRTGKVLYAITIRAFIGASDSLILYTHQPPDAIADYQSKITSLDMPRPLKLDDKGNPVDELQQPISTDQWTEDLREMSLWKYIKDPKAFPADLKMQYRFRDNTTWQPIYCSSKDSTYICGYDPIEWKFQSSYFWQGDVYRGWLVTQILGEVGVRTLGFSYASGPYAGTGILFAQAQGVLRQKYIKGYTTPEDLITLDCRACTYPDTLKQVWQALHQ